MAKSTATIDLVPQEVLDELKSLDSQLDTTKNNLNELLKPVISISTELQKTATNYKQLTQLINNFNNVEKQINNEFNNQKIVMSALEKAQQRLVQLETDEAKQLALLKEKIKQKNKANEESAKAMLEEAKAAEELKKKLSDIGNSKSVTIKTRNVTEDVNVSSGNSHASAINSADELSKRFNSISASGFSDVSAMINKNTQGLVDYSAAMSELATRIASVDSLQESYTKSLNAGLITEEEYADKTKSLASIGQKLGAELDSLNDKYATSKQEMSGFSAISEQATEAFANLSEKGKELTLTLLESNEAQKQIKSTISDLDKEYERGSIGLEEYNSKKAELVTLSNTYKDVTKSVSRELNNEIKASQSAAGSYNNLSARYSLIKEQLNKMTESGKGSTEQFKKMQEEAKALYEEMKKLQSATGKNQLNVGNYPQEVKSLTRDIENNIKQLALMKVQGQENSDEYKQLAKRTAVLKDAMVDATSEIRNMASDTSDLNSVLGFASAAGGGFAAMTGAMELFGAESGNVAEAQKKLQSVIAITTGLQSLQNAVQKQSAVMLGISKIQSLALAKAETLKNVATKSGIASTVGATIAQKAFNVVANANPYVLLATALITVVGALVAFSSSSNNAAEKQEKLNELARIHAEALDYEAEKIRKEHKARIALAEYELQMGKARQESTEKIRKLEDDVAAARRRQNQVLAGFYGDRLGDLDKNIEKLDDLNKQLDSVKTTLNRGGNVKVEVNINGKIEEMKAQDAVSALQGKIDEYGGKVEIATQLKEEDQELKRQTELKAEQRRQEDLKKAKEHQEKLKKIQDAENKAAFDLSNEQIKHSANKNKEIAEDETKSYEERLRALKNFASEMKQSVSDMADNQIENLINTTAKEMNMDPVKKRAELEEKLSNQIYLIRFKSAQESLKIDTDASETSIEIEKDRVDKILAQKNRLASDKNIEIDVRESENLKNLAKEYGNDESKYEEYEQKKTAIARNAALERLKVQKSLIDASFEALNVDKNMADEDIKASYGEETLDKVKDLKRQEADYIIAMNQLEIASSESASEKTEKAWKKAFDKIATYINSAMQVADSLVQLSSAKTEQKINDLEKESEASEEWAESEKERVEDLEESGAISKEQADARKAAIDDQAQLREEQIEQKKKEALKKQATYERAMSIAQIAWSTAQSIMASAQLGFPAAIPFIAMAAAAGALQTAAVLATPIPEYAHGTEDHPGGLAIVGDGGKSEMVLANGRMFKTPSTDTLVDLPQHAVVLPDFAAAMAMQKLPDIPERKDRIVGLEELTTLMKDSNQKMTTLLKMTERKMKNDRYARELNNVRPVKR